MLTALVFASLLSASPVHAAEAVRLENLVATEEEAVPEAEFEASLAAFAATRGTRGNEGGGGNRPNWMTSGNRPNWYTSSNRPNWVTAGNRPNWLTAGSRPNWYTGAPAFKAESANYPEPSVSFEE